LDDQEEFNQEMFEKALIKAKEEIDQEYSELIEDFRKLIPIDNKAGIEEKYAG